MYKVQVGVLENIKKQLVESNKQLEKYGNSVNTDVAKTIKANEKQIKILELNYFIK